MHRERVFHTNDMHSCFESFFHIAKYLKQHANKDVDLIVDGGDFADQRSIMVNGTDGIGAIELLKQANYDAMACGNNEFFLGAKALVEMGNCGFPILTCNLYDLDGEVIENLHPFMHLRKGGITYLLIGISPYFRNTDAFGFMEHNGVNTICPNDMIRNIIERNKNTYDVCICISHLGFKKDQLLARDVDGIDLIIGAHSHDAIELTCINGTYIHQSGSYGKYLGVVEFDIDDSFCLKNVIAKNILVKDMNVCEDKDVKDVYLKQLKIAENRLMYPLYEISEPLSYDAFKECMVVNALVDAMYDEYDVDFACINNGILEGGIGGLMSQYKLIRICPSGLIPVVVEWYGYQIIEALKKSFELEFIKDQGRGSGFRGSVLGSLSFSYNVKVNKNTFDVYIDGCLLEEDQLYTIATSDYLQRGSGYYMLGLSKKEVVFKDGYIRDLLKRHLDDESFIKRCKQRRIEYDK